MKTVSKFLLCVLTAALGACAQGPNQYASPPMNAQKMSDEALCLGYADDPSNAALAREITARALDCTDLLTPDENHALPDRSWRDNVDATIRALRP